MGAHRGAATSRINRRIIALTGVGVVLLVAGGTVAVQAATTAATTAACTADSYAGSTLALHCVVPQATVTRTVTRTATVTASPSASPTVATPTPTPTPSPTVSVTPSPSPTTSTTIPPASTGGFPTAATTGVPAGTVLKSSVNASGTGWTGDSNGNVTVSAGATASGLDVKGTATLQAGATLKNSRVRCIGEDSFCVTMDARTTLQDSEVGGGADGVTYGYAAGIWTGDFDSTTARNLILRDNIHSLTRAVQNDGQTTVQDSYFHDSVYDCAYHDTIPTAGNQQCGLHSSASFMSKGHGITYQHNTLQDGSTAVLFGQVYDNDGSSLGNVTISNNRIRATREPNGYTSSFGVSIEFKHIDNPASIRITNNVFDANPWDVGEYRNDCPTGTASCYTVSGNTTVPSGSAINP